MVSEDVKPWYRQFWPWFIIALPAATVVAGLTTLWISMQTTDSLVVHGEDGIRKAADRQISAQRFASEMNLAALIDIDPDTGVIKAVIRAGKLEELPTALEFELSHPTFANHDLAVTLNRALPDAEGNPVWVGHILSVPEGRYYAVLHAGDAWRLTAEWQGEASLMLRPGGNDGN